MTARPLSAAEVTLARGVFGDAIDYAKVRVHARKWAFFQPRETVMAPDGDIWLHPAGSLTCDCMASGGWAHRGTFIHELTHVWQAQTRGRWYLPLMRHPFCRYDYVLRPGWPLVRYGVEQQAEIVRHAFMLMQGQQVRGAPPLAQYLSILPFRGDAARRPA